MEPGWWTAPPIPDAERCVADHRHDPDRPRRAADGLRLCRGCVEHLRRTLGELPDVYRDLEAALSADAAPALSGGPAGPPTGGRLPFRPAVADHLAQIRWETAWWCRYIAQARGMALPADQSIRGVARWLDRHVDWLAAHDWADNPRQGMIALTGRARALIDPTPISTFPLPEPNRCLAEYEGQPCAGTLVAVIRREEISDVTCSDCGASWPPDQWRRLGRQLHGRTRRRTA